MITFDVPLWVVLQAAAATGLPLLVGLVTSKVTSSGAKAVLLAALTLLSSLAGQLADALQNGTEYNVGLAVVSGLVGFAVSVGVHYGLLKPTGATAAVQAVGAGSDLPEGRR